MPLVCVRECEGAHWEKSLWRNPIDQKKKGRVFFRERFEEVGNSSMV